MTGDDFERITGGAFSSLESAIGPQMHELNVKHGEENLRQAKIGTEMLKDYLVSRTAVRNAEAYRKQGMGALLRVVAALVLLYGLFLLPVVVIAAWKLIP